MNQAAHASSSQRTLWSRGLPTLHPPPPDVSIVQSLEQPSPFASLSSSQPSPVSRTPSPQTGSAQSAWHPSPSVVFSSSQASPTLVSSMPLPQVSSERQSALHPSPSVLLSSSQTSLPATTPSPQRAGSTVRLFSAQVPVDAPVTVTRTMAAVAVLGATTQFMGPGEVFEKLSNHVIDGVTFPMEALNSFNLAPHLTNTLKVDGGLYNTTWFLVMNEGRWDGLSDQDKAAIEGISGAALSAKAGVIWDEADQAGIAAAEAAKVSMDDAPAEVLAHIQTIAAAHEAAWSEKLAAEGFDGQAALARIRELAAD